jgi:hypothetical protein
VPSAIAQYLVHSRSSIGAEMKAIRYLDRPGRALATSLGARDSAIADDGLNTGVCAQPVSEDLGGAVVKRVNGSTRLQIWLVAEPPSAVDARCGRAKADQADVEGSCCAGVGSIHHTSDTERRGAWVPQRGRGCRRARQLSGRCTSAPSIHPSIRPSAPTSMRALPRSDRDRRTLDILRSSSARQALELTAHRYVSRNSSVWRFRGRPVCRPT